MKRTIVLIGFVILTMAARAATVGIAWDAVTTNADGSAISDLAGYEVFTATYSLTGMTTAQALSAGTVAKQAAAVTTTADIAGLLDATTYYIRLTAFDASGNHSGWSAQSDGVTDLEISTRTPSPQPPAAPALTAAAASSTQINLSWTNVANETGYRLERSSNGGVTFSTVTKPAANVTSYNDTGRAPLTTYTYRVFAINTAGETVSNTASATTPATPVTAPSAPTTLAAVAVSSAQITLTWKDASNNEDGFTVMRSLTQGSGFVQITTLGPNPGTGGTVTYNDATGLAAGTMYYYEVRAYNAAGNSAYTPVKSAQTTAVVTPQGNGTTPPGLAYAFPNPAVGKDPTIRAMMDADSVEITIFDASGQVVHTARVTQSTMVNGQTVFEYVWNGRKATGVYFAVIHGKNGGETIRARTKFAVVR